MKRTPEEKLLNPRPGSKIAAARDFGIDLTLLIENLRLTPTQRLIKNQDAANGLRELRKAMLQSNAKTKSGTK